MPPTAEGLASRLILRPALRAQPDGRLVSLVREGYETAFEEIVRRYGRPLGRYAAAIVGGRSEDVTQDAFSKALIALRRDDSEIELRPWLFRIVRNTALNDLRDSPPSPELLAEAIAGGGDPTEELERREALADLMRRLHALPEPQRAAIVMRELEGLGHDEIAVALGLSGGAARQAIYRARQALRSGMGMIVPLPLLKALLAGGGGTVEAAAGASGAVGGGIALKATAATVLVAGALGAGVALENGHRAHRVKPAAHASDARGGAEHAGSATLVSATPSAKRAASEFERSGRSKDGPGRDSGATDGHHNGRETEHSGAKGSPEHRGNEPSHSGGGQAEPARPNSSDRLSRDGEHSGQASTRTGDSVESSGDSHPESSGTGSSPESGATTDGSQSEGDSPSGESEGGESDSGESRDSHGGDGLTEVTTPEP